MIQLVPTRRVRQAWLPVWYTALKSASELRQSVSPFIETAAAVSSDPQKALASVASALQRTDVRPTHFPSGKL